MIIDPTLAGYGDTRNLVTEMIGGTFDALFFGAAGGPCWIPGSTMITSQEPGISEVGRMVLYYFALR